jgi:tyrosinase
MEFIIMPTRRDVLLASAATTALLLVEGKKARSVGVALRPDIMSEAGQKMVDLYANAVLAMQDPEINYPPQPQSWIFQAYIHGVPINPFDPANSGGLWTGTQGLKKRVDEIYGNPADDSPQAAWKRAALGCWGSCTHGRPYFLTWHRWYMYYFEAICRKMCNVSEFMLPYWNYASDIGPSLQLPAKFQYLPPAGEPPNPLFFDDRGLGFSNPKGEGPQNAAMNNGAYMPYSAIDYGPALSAMVMFPSEIHFRAPPDPGYLELGFTGRVECVPHDNVHTNIGGWMGNIPSAASDPIFYMHHCQIDRLYASWEAVSGVSYNWGSSFTQPDENTWKTQMASFVDENGKLVTRQLGDAKTTDALMYGYDKLATPPPQELASLWMAKPTSRLKLAAMESQGFRVQSGGSSVTLAPASNALSEATQNAARSIKSSTLILQGIRLLRRPPAPLSVFLNLPKGTMPELNGPYYVGTLNFFNFDLGTGDLIAHTGDSAHADHAMPGAEARFDVTELLQRQRSKGLWDGGPITVTITTIGADTPGTITYVTIESVALVP